MPEVGALWDEAEGRGGRERLDGMVSGAGTCPAARVCGGHADVDPRDDSEYRRDVVVEAARRDGVAALADRLGERGGLGALDAG